MDNSTNQELHRMTVKHRLFGVVITTFLGFSTYVLVAEEVVDIDNSTTLNQTNSDTETDSDLDAEPVKDQLTKKLLQELSKEEFKEYMLNMDQYSKNDRNALLLEYQRRCSDDSKDSSTDLCPDDIEPTFGNTDRDSGQGQVEDDQPMPQLIEQRVEVGSTVRANSNSESVVESDPRIKNNKSDQKNKLLPSWKSK